MSKLFFDHLIEFEEVEIKINNSAGSAEEKQELWQIVDETLHHRVFGCILDNLHKDHHQEFLTKFHQAPHDEGILDYLTEKIENITDLIKEEMSALASEIFEEL